MKVFALYNMKGGVGKTTGAVNLASLSAADGHRTLLWDLDPQASATYYLRVEPRIEGAGRSLLLEDADLGPHILRSDLENLDVLPADFSCRKMESVLAAAEGSSQRLERALRPLSGRYEHVFLDCVPNVSSLSEAVLAAADVLLIPTIPTTLSMRTLARQMPYLRKRARRGFRPLPFFSMVDGRKALHRSVSTWVHEQELGFLRTEIPYSSVVERMGVLRRPILGYARSSKPGLAYRALWDEIQERTVSVEAERPLYSRAVGRQLEGVAGTDPRRRSDPGSSLRPAASGASHAIGKPV